MSHFYGTIDGSARTQATRRGTKSSGLTVHAASWEGAVRVELYELNGTDYARVSLTTWHGAGCQPAVVLYDGPLAEYKPATSSDNS